MAREIYLLDSPQSSGDKPNNKLHETLDWTSRLGVGSGDIEPIIFHGPEVEKRKDAQVAAERLGAKAIVPVEFFPLYRKYEFVNGRQCTALTIGSIAYALGALDIKLSTGSSEQFVIVGESDLAQAFSKLHPGGAARDAFHVDPKSPIMNHYFLEYIKVV